MSQNEPASAETRSLTKYARHLPTLTLAAAVVIAAVIWIAIYRFDTALSEGIDSQSKALERMEQSITELAASVAKLKDDAPDFEPVFWTQLYPDQIWDGESKSWVKEEEVGRLLARAIVPMDRDCPTVTVDDDRMVMNQRDLIYPTIFPVILCEMKLPPAGNLEAFISSDAFGGGKKTLAAWNGNAKKILVIGDTGCRVTYYPTPQHCKEGTKKSWPFPRIANLASQISDIDLIVHVGDYHYRERPCPVAEKTACGKHSGGYVWDAWKADFFDPARKLLAHVPWVFVRGNHENCERAGAGWTDFFWPELTDDRFNYCQDYHEPYVVDLADGLSLVVLDIANSESAKYYENGAANDRGEMFGNWIKGLGQVDLKESVWIAMQQPPWQWPTKDNEQQETAAVRDETVKQIQKYLRAPAAAGIDASVELVLAGDTHIFQALRPDKGAKFPWVVISGMGGTSLDGKDDFEEILKVGGASIPLDATLDENLKDQLEGQSVTAFGWHGFGYTILEKKTDEWKAVVFNEQGNPVYECDLTQGGDCGVPK